MDDPGLVADLDGHKVNYSGHYESKFLSNVLSWVIPIGIFFLIWRFTMKKMGPGMGPRFVEEAHQRVSKILSDHRTVLDELAHLLSRTEVVTGAELRKMMGKPPVEPSTVPQAS